MNDEVEIQFTFLNNYIKYLYGLEIIIGYIIDI